MLSQQVIEMLRGIYRQFGREEAVARNPERSLMSLLTAIHQNVHQGWAMLRSTVEMGTDWLILEKSEGETPEE